MVALLVLVIVLMPGCVRSPGIEGREWQPVNQISDGEPQDIGVVFYLPNSRSGGLDERVDPEHYLIVAVHYDGCSLTEPRFVGIDRARLEIRFTDLHRQCLRPVPMTAWFAIPWSELPTEIVVVDQLGAEHVISDRRLSV